MKLYDVWIMPEPNDPYERPPNSFNSAALYFAEVVAESHTAAATEVAEEYGHVGRHYTYERDGSQMITLRRKTVWVED